MDTKTKEIEKYVSELDWNCSIDQQNEAIRFLSETDEKYYTLFFDKTKKSTWENAVKVVAKIGFPRNEPFLKNMVWLLRDVNWPGATQALEILSSVEKAKVLPIIEEALLLADAEDDFMWVAGIRILVSKAGYRQNEFTDKEIYKILRKADF